MRRNSIVAVLLAAAAAPFTVAFEELLQRRDLRQPLPLSVDGRWILDAKNESIALVGVNWPGHLETMLPEGLQYQSVSNIVTKIAEIGFNSVRLTFASEMVDDIVERGGDVSLKVTLEKALGSENGTKVMKQIMKNNPSFNESTKRLDIWNAVAGELAKQDLFLHLDNHVSKAVWCCDPFDGNSWFGDTHFNTSNWVRSLSFMAEHGKANWKSFSSMGLRNELRPPLDNPQPPAELDLWETWKTRMLQGANAIHNANPEILIFFGGRLGDKDIGDPVRGSSLAEPNFNFSIAEQPFKNKFVFELHQYDSDLLRLYIVGDQGSFNETFDVLGGNTTTASLPGSNKAPLVISEWGHDQTDKSGVYKQEFHKFLFDYMIGRSLHWMVWTIGGSYYVREGKADYDETWGLLDHKWDSFQGKDSIKALQAEMRATYKSLNQSMPPATKDVGKGSGGVHSPQLRGAAAGVSSSLFVAFAFALVVAFTTVL
ncbi:endo-beta-1 [Colletotrichum karsti]|uniref:Endo-beta-1 n=1 Tax=Colletotrichum karsti TaxID=1095194 RepID=A0A9P6HW25_9PEZI|nr:endo-beta-1 [Colletotrichum karsti]KAF9869951.1 endo-beta-1 [Colletotrichum karsti]